ncbi:MAG: hypothetical protein EOS04_24505 [Mesorhizobium sp.]|nr:MAG: hypothetical protein EOR98_26845 [Mesorhizobium sp.]RWN73226.1 MAG: hypothetical protein EOS01_26705 [Mesorhizobium sp.]RWN85235.1 MAG: hypothetical protein EOS04_24505 [Mesorhizobium sp.]RWO08264.1 MAG: hypothetical protein EOS15_29695 [Mesorhizobium sp.]
MVRLEDAPEFTDACFDDLARKHLRDIIAELEERVSSLQSTIDSLEKDRPHWARGYTSDGVAAQVMMVALNGLWDLLGASNQTEAMGKLRELVGGERIAA